VATELLSKIVTAISIMQHHAEEILGRASGVVCDVIFAHLEYLIPFLSTERTQSLHYGYLQLKRGLRVRVTPFAAG
jgi:hypothetical protein